MRCTRRLQERCLASASMTRVRSLLVSAALGLTVASLAGCGSAQPSYYTLSTWPGTAQAGGPLTIKVRTPSVAAYLDRDTIVRDDRGYKLKLADNAAWGEPLGNMIGRTLTQDLQQRLPGTTVFAESGAISTDAEATVEINISQFAEDRDGNAEIIATLLVQRPDSGPTSAQAIHMTASPEGTNVGALAAALSKLLGQVADEAARQARALAPMPPPLPPA